MRLLQCMDCRTVDELPDYNGRPEDDVLLQYVIDTKHPKLGGIEDHKGALHYVETKAYEANKAKILEEMWAKTTGFKPEYYQARSTFQEDAYTCWNRDHNRPHFCSDFQTEKKRIKNPTKEGWKSQDPKMKIFLCDFCPVKANVQSAENLKNKSFD